MHILANQLTCATRDMCNNQVMYASRDMCNKTCATRDICNKQVMCATRGICNTWDVRQDKGNTWHMQQVTYATSFVWHVHSAKVHFSRLKSIFFLQKVDFSRLKPDFFAALFPPQNRKLVFLVYFNLIRRMLQKSDLSQRREGWFQIFAKKSVVGKNPYVLWRAGNGERKEP